MPKFHQNVKCIEMSLASKMRHDGVKQDPSYCTVFMYGDSPQAHHRGEKSVQSNTQLSAYNVFGARITNDTFEGPISVEASRGHPCKWHRRFRVKFHSGGSERLSLYDVHQAILIARFISQKAALEFSYWALTIPFIR